MNTSMINALTIDVEDYFQVSAFEPYIARADWERLECRIPRNMDRILQMLDERDVKATFFTLGWVAERYPEVVRRIVAQGHELASHGWGHQRARDLSPGEFTQDVVRAKHLLEDLGGVEVLGYRAPSFSIGAQNLWCFARLADAGYRYSSSVYPIAHDHYGMPESPRFAYRATQSLLEVPATTIRLGERNLPCSGGGYFRLLPYAASKAMIRRVNAVDRQPAVFYFHPWEIDPQQPRPQGLDLRTRFRHYVNLSRNEAKLQRLLRDFRWGRMDEIFLGLRQAPKPERPAAVNQPAPLPEAA